MMKIELVYDSIGYDFLGMLHFHGADIACIYAVMNFC
jgi:hypothetical protein